MADVDWTKDPKTGRSNSSEEFHSLMVEVARLIQESAHTLIAGNTRSVARLILAQLAHVHGMRAKPTQAEVDVDFRVKEDVNEAHRLLKDLLRLPETSLPPFARARVETAYDLLHRVGRNLDGAAEGEDEVREYVCGNNPFA